MVELLTIVCLLLLAIAIAMLAMLLARLRATPELGRTFAETMDRTDRSLREEIARNREETASSASLARQEVSSRLDAITRDTAGRLDAMRQENTLAAKAAAEQLIATLRLMAESQKTQLQAFAQALAKLADSHDQQAGALKTTLQTQLQALQEDNAKRLEQMRATVDEKLQGTLERRLGEAFNQVSQRLEAVSRGLGEMQTLATGVGDLKRVLTNVKARGTWGEGRLEAMLAEVLTTEQYATNIDIHGTGERVEFAIRLPGRSDDKTPVYLPIDAKYPAEDYQRLLDAQERADAPAAEEAGRQLEIRIKACAADIAGKYVHPPKSTDFGILFVPFEGLFAEILRRPGLAEYVQREYHIMIAGPTTLWALLSSLQMGFRTLAIQQRTSEVWTLLGAVKTEWSKYGEVLERVQKKLQEASNTIDQAQVRNRAIGRTLRSVEALPTDDATSALLPADTPDQP